ncbi:unnamed protein product [Caretta caretta]
MSVVNRNISFFTLCLVWVLQIPTSFDTVAFTFAFSSPATGHTSTPAHVIIFDVTHAQITHPPPPRAADTLLPTDKSLGQPTKVWDLHLLETAALELCIHPR